MGPEALIIVIVVVLALFFDFTNGFHDTANAMATPIATGALRPKVAVLLAALLNLGGAFLSTEVAKTISGGIIHESEISAAVFPAVIFAGLIGAITWNMLTWLFGLPSSSSHALFGGLIGATLVGVGAAAIDFGVVMTKVILPALIAPLTAGLIAFAVTKIAYAVTRRADARPTGRVGFKWGQIFTSSLVALAHGTNDAQKTMGIITLALLTVGWQTGAEPQLWVIFASALAIAVGTYSGGWRIIRTMGKGLTDVRPAQGFAAEASTASTILASSTLGFALSTTQVASGSVVGVGLGRRGGRVRWLTVSRMMVGWILTIPAAGIVGALAALVVVWLDGWGVLIDSVAAVVIVSGLFLYSRRHSVSSHNAMSDELAPSEPSEPSSSTASESATSESATSESTVQGERSS